MPTTILSSPYRYGTTAEFKAWVTSRNGTISTDAADDTVIEDILEAVSRRIDTITGRRYYYNTNDETRYYTADESYYLYMDDLAATPTSVSVDYSANRTYTALTISTDIELEPVNAALRGQPYTALAIHPTSTAYFPEGVRRGVKVVGKFGFPSLPVNIQEGCIQIAHNVWMSRQGQVGAGRMTVTASGVVIRPEDIPPGVMSDLMAYRKYT